MLKLENYFKVLFQTVYVGESSFIRFVEDHLQRLIANNTGGRYNAIVAALTTALSNLKNVMDDRNFNQSQQESKTVAVDKVIADFKAMISRSQVDITDRWSEDHEIFQAFFPRGLEEYTQSNKGNIAGLMTRWISTCNMNRANLPDGYADPYTTLLSDYEAKRAAQLGLIGNTDGNRHQVSVLRSAVALQLTINVHTLALDHLGQPEAVSVFFDQSIIRRPVRTNGAEPEPEVLSDAVAPLASAVILHGSFDGNTIFHVVNTGSVNLKFYTANLPDDPVPGTALELAPGEEDEVLASDLGAATNLFLMARNDHATIAGSYEVSVAEQDI